MGFREDLRFGKYYERKYEPMLNEKFGKTTRPAPNRVFKDFDFEFENGCVEVKADRMVEGTGNFYIEFECNGKPSGISATKSTHYLLINASKEDEYYLVSTHTLISIANEENCRVVCGGDGGRTKGFLVKKNLLVRFKNI
jgi:hypothetical protein